MTVESKAAVWLLGCAVAVDDRGGDDVRAVGVGAADGDGLSIEGNVAVAVAGVGAGADDDGIAAYCDIDGRLNRAEIGWAVVIDCDYAGGAGIGQQGKYADKNQPSHSVTSSKGSTYSRF
jgi:hypothetical protein